MTYVPSGKTSHGYIILRFKQAFAIARSAYSISISCLSLDPEIDEEHEIFTKVR